MVGTLRRAALAPVALVLSAALTGCSIDSVIWGQDGARVIQTTEELVDAMADGNPTDLICADSAAELGVPAIGSACRRASPSASSQTIGTSRCRSILNGTSTLRAYPRV